ncbi:hypothetical protein BDK51DRAFT_33439 [Blyttiomyces helicus]|uniref:Uncharacterized protein n=1 Tax=Blyttiomyces helicus TaxID=388810 RepID=A0A4P9WD27_9FUNG|nr:hypothetical protein BDK51DRAFT_33439 [Blyttiomyces helicus]|eukprot:RKO90242.1 hypothetical protein BDK51DRAFT_33439 [Blyttiomyces helicus]
MSPVSIRPTLADRVSKRIQTSLHGVLFKRFFDYPLYFGGKDDVGSIGALHTLPTLADVKTVSSAFLPSRLGVFHGEEPRGVPELHKGFHWNIRQDALVIRVDGIAAEGILPAMKIVFMLRSSQPLDTEIKIDTHVKSLRETREIPLIKAPKKRIAAHLIAGISEAREYTIELTATTFERNPSVIEHLQNMWDAYGKLLNGPPNRSIYLIPRSIEERDMIKEGGIDQVHVVEKNAAILQMSAPSPSQGVIQTYFKSRVAQLACKTQISSKHFKGVKDSIKNAPDAEPRDGPHYRGRRGNFRKGRGKEAEIEDTKLSTVNAG